jgi:hydroxypyruvate reductase
MTLELLGTARASDEPWMDPIAARFPLFRLTPADDLDAVVEGRPERIGGIVSGGGFTVTAELLERLPNAKVIAVTGAGFDRVDVEAARARGIQICNAPGTTDRCVADMAFGLLLAAGRRIVAGDRFVREGRWRRERAPILPRISGRPLGIYGLGGIGRQIARRAEGFEMEVHYHNRRPRDDAPWHYHASLADLADAVDLLVVACPLTEETRGTVGADILRRLGPGGVLVNIARGAVLDEEVLTLALETGVIAAAGLDVLTREPEVPPRLAALDNVVLSPHTAGSTQGTWEEVIAAVIANLDAFVASGRVLTPIPDRL